MAPQAKRVSALVSSLESQGCKVKRTSSGWWVGFPNGLSTSFHLTPSDHRSEKNLRGTIRRNGLEWPFD